MAQAGTEHTSCAGDASRGIAALAYHTLTMSGSNLAMKSLSLQMGPNEPNTCGCSGNEFCYVYDTVEVMRSEAEFGGDTTALSGCDEHWNDNEFEVLQDVDCLDDDENGWRGIESVASCQSLCQAAGRTYAINGYDGNCKCGVHCNNLKGESGFRFSRPSGIPIHWGEYLDRHM